MKNSQSVSSLNLISRMSASSGSSSWSSASPSASSSFVCSLLMSSSSFSAFSNFVAFLQDSWQLFFDQTWHVNVFDQNLTRSKQLTLRTRQQLPAATSKCVSPVLPPSDARLQWMMTARPLRLWAARRLVIAVRKKSYFVAGSTPHVVRLHHTITEWSSADFTSCNASFPNPEDLRYMFLW